jgi:hypothetical protein
MEQTTRMARLLWYVGYCGDFPAQLASRIEGHPEWNRHVMYAGLKKGYLVLYRVKYRDRIVRSLRITEDGLHYLASKDPGGYNTVLAHKSVMQATHLSNAPERILRRHAEAISLVMAEHAGAAIMPDSKPSLRKKDIAGASHDIESGHAYYYSMFELRAGIREGSEDTSPRTSRLCGVIVRDRHCWCIYHSGRTRMFWLQANEENAASAVQALLYTRGFHCDTVSQVIIGTTMTVAAKLAKPASKVKHAYFSISNAFSNCFFVTNDSEGDALLCDDNQSRYSGTFLQKSAFLPMIHLTCRHEIMMPLIPKPGSLSYWQPVVTFSRSSVSPRLIGSVSPPVVLCLDYQARVIQQIIGPSILVRTL